VAHRRDTADSEAGALPDEVGVRLLDGLTHCRGQQALVDPVRPGRDHQHRSTALGAAEHKRLRDLGDVAAQRGSCLWRCARRVGQLAHLRVDAALAQRLRDSTHAGIHERKPRSLIRE
jgi:hypothetical protein